MNPMSDLLTEPMNLSPRGDGESNANKLLAAQKRKICLDRQRTKKTQQMLKQQQIGTNVQIVDLQPTLIGYPTPEPPLLYVSPFTPFAPIGFFPSPPIICLPMVTLPNSPQTTVMQSGLVETREDKLERYRQKRSTRTYVRPKDQRRQSIAKNRRRESNGLFAPNLPAEQNLPSVANPSDFGGVEKASIRYILNF